MKIRSIIIALAIILTPFVIGISLFIESGNRTIHKEATLVTDTRKNNQGISYKGIKIDWTFYPDWEYKPLLFHAEEYLVFVFHYTNISAYDVSVMPSYTFASPRNRRYSANEEIAMYIESDVENKLKVNDETPITFKIPPDVTKHYIVTFEKPHSLKKFYVDVDVFRDVALRIHYKKENGSWVNYKNEFAKKFKGRG